jgi:aminopeptidase N
MNTNLVSKKRLDYQKPSHTIKDVDLTFDLEPNVTKITSVLSIKRLDNTVNTLFLNGEDLDLESVSINGKTLLETYDYRVLKNGLEILSSLDNFTLKIINSIKPTLNTSLEGLYFSNNAYCTQCEAEGFRKITYFLDRPDVLATYKVTINSVSEQDTFLLSNGNKTTDTGFVNGMRTCVWEDPFPKPCYLFALVAGHFDLLEDEFLTKSGKEVALQLFVDEGRLGQGQHALDSLKKSMLWDEQTYGLEYDLDIYMVVAVDFFNMGAMENKGLNVFNSKYVLADANTATDEDYFNIESIIAHEYFHNWTGNRVTCRDWFQLSLKEGLTVFRDQQFSADMYSDLLTRISQVNVMREHQFAEDASPMSHPIRPDEVMEMNNFYTVTVYDKGAEVIRMLHTLLGKAGFRKGMDEYFFRHDGQAVTCDDFVNAMQDANDIDLSQFKIWYSQSGTPIVHVQQSVTDDQQCKFTFTQINKPTADQVSKKNLYLPIKLELFTQDGKKVDTNLDKDTLILQDESTSLVVNANGAKLTPSLLQDFSAPVKIEYEYMLDELLVILQCANNDYAKWEASQNAYQLLIKQAYHENVSKEYYENIQERFLVSFAKTLTQIDVANEVLAEILSVPSLESLTSQIEKVDPLVLHKVRHELMSALAQALESFCEEKYEVLANKHLDYAYEKEQVNDRRLKNMCLFMLAYTNSKSINGLIQSQFNSAKNMTDRLGALRAANALQNEVFDEMMVSFEQQFGDDAVVMDKWFALHAKAEKHDVLSHLDLLQAHQQFSIKNPNKVRSVIGTFAFYNTLGFHQKDGSGYKYLANYLITIDKINPQVASRLVTPLIQYARYAVHNQHLMKAQLERLYGIKGLSRDLFEKISKALITN